MDKFILESFKNAIQFVGSSTFSQSVKMASPIEASIVSNLMPPAGTLKELSKVVSTTSDLMPPTGTLKNLSDAMSLASSINVSELNVALQQIALLSKTDFQKIKNTVYENHSQIYNTAKTNIETVYSIVEQSNQDNNDETLIMSEQVAELVNTIDNSVEFSQPDSDKQIHIKKSDTDYSKIIGILISIMSLLISFAALVCSNHQSNASTELSKQNHAELMQEEHQQTEELKQQTQEEQRQTKILEKMLNSNDASVSLSTPSTPHKD